MKSQEYESAEQLTGVAETLMITVYARYLETQRKDSLLQDPQAVEIFERTRYNFDKYAKGWASQLGIIIRVREIDRIVREFFEVYPEAIVINLGCGLCTRFARIENNSARWYEVDFPEVIEFRQKFLPESDRDRTIAQSILDFTWMD